MNEEKELFNFLNKKNTRYVVLRGTDKKSKELGKDIDILILKEDYEKIKNIYPKLNRPVDFYINEEKHKGIVFVPTISLFRRTFDKKLGFYVLDEKDARRMVFFRKILHKIREIKTFFGMYEKKQNEPLNIIKRNYEMFGMKYIFYDFFYQFFRILNNLTKQEIKKPKKIIKKKINDYEMFINKNGKGIHHDLNLNSTREFISMNIVKSLLKKEEVVLEAGANIGYYVILESKKIGEKGLIYAVEPSKESFELLNKNIKLNNLKNVKSFNLGFNDKKGILELNVSEDSNLNSPISLGNNAKIEKVKCTTLDEFFKNKKKPTFMRMDIEGFEDIVFKGGEKTLESLKTIFVELHFPLLEKERMIELLKLLKNKGFEINKAVMEWERWEDESNILGKIVNFLHKKRSKPIVYENLTINKLIKNKNFIEGHLSLEVFFVKKG